MRNLANKTGAHATEQAARNEVKMVRLFEQLCSNDSDSARMEEKLWELIRLLRDRCSQEVWVARAVKLVGDAESIESLLGSVDDQIVAAKRKVDADPELAAEVLAEGRAFLCDTIKAEWGNLSNLLSHELHTADLLIAGKFKLKRFMEWESGMGEIAHVASSLLIVEELLGAVFDADGDTREAAIYAEHMERWDSFLAAVVEYTERKMRSGVSGRLAFSIKRLSEFAGSSFFETFYPYLVDGGAWAQVDRDDEMSDEEFERASSGPPWWIGPKSQLNLDLAARQIDALYAWASVSLEFRKLLNVVKAIPNGAERGLPASLDFDPKSKALTFTNTAFDGWNNASWIGPPPGCAGIALVNCLMQDCDLIMTPAATRWNGLTFYGDGMLMFSGCDLSFDAPIDTLRPDVGALFIDGWLRSIAEVYQIDPIEGEEVDDQAPLMFEMVVLRTCRILLDGRPYKQVSNQSYPGEVVFSDVT
jgi:hypothetical protein